MRNCGRGDAAGAGRGHVPARERCGKCWEECTGTREMCKRINSYFPLQNAVPQKCLRKKL